jgi:hypothetical protein
MSLRPAAVDPQGGPITGKRGGPMPLAKSAQGGPMLVAGDKVRLPLRRRDRLWPNGKSLTRRPLHEAEKLGKHCACFPRQFCAEPRILSLRGRF